MQHRLLKLEIPFISDKEFIMFQNRFQILVISDIILYVISLVRVGKMHQLSSLDIRVKEPYLI